LALASNTAPQTDAVAQADKPTSIGISRTLFFGLLASIAIMILGLILVALQGKNVATHVVTLNRVLPDFMGGSGSALLDTGILVLFATPLLGVLVAFVQFVRQRDTAFSLITALLLLVLGAGFLVALH
jgi:uncharacterized membrane protein